MEWSPAAKCDYIKAFSGSSPTPSPSLVKPPLPLTPCQPSAAKFNSSRELAFAEMSAVTSKPRRGFVRFRILVLYNHASIFMPFLVSSVTALPTLRPLLLDFHPLRRIFTSVMSDLTAIGSSHTSKDLRSHAKRGRKRGNNDAGSGEICNFPPHVCRWNNGRAIYGNSHPKPFRD